MEPLTESILGMEQEADEVLAAARAEAARAEERAEQEADAHRVELDTDVNRRVEAFGREAESAHQAAIQEAEEKLRTALDAIENVPAKTFEKQVKRVVERFREL